MPAPNEIQQLMGYTEVGDEAYYAKPEMLRRLAQLALAGSRGINNNVLAQHMGLSRETTRRYWLGHPVIADEDSIDRAIEEISKERDLDPGPVEWGYIDGHTTRELMQA